MEFVWVLIWQQQFKNQTYSETIWDLWKRWFWGKVSPTWPPFLISPHFSALEISWNFRALKHHPLCWKYINLYLYPNLLSIYPDSYTSYSLDIFTRITNLTCIKLWNFFQISSSQSLLCLMVTPSCQVRECPYQQTLLALPWEYFQNMIIFHMSHSYHLGKATVISCLHCCHSLLIVSSTFALL